VCSDQYCGREDLGPSSFGQGSPDVPRRIRGGYFLDIQRLFSTRQVPSIEYILLSLQEVEIRLTSDLLFAFLVSSDLFVSAYHFAKMDRVVAMLMLLGLLVVSIEGFGLRSPLSVRSLPN